ncbi:thiamine diphosphokinase [Shimia sp. SDUM112013]|uniref:thiamine diphosphokinase n=1 Tax=Shimia sp. SDUM112013 TaxID=3136160 RepID=UPI0032F07C81
MGKGDLALCRALAPTLVAADGGVGHCLPYGIIPRCVIGDLDSLSDNHRANIPEDRLWHIAEQDSTDFDKALRHIEAPLVIGVGFTGGRIDHQLSCYSSLLGHPDRRCLLLGEEDVVFLCPPQFTIDLSAGTRLSLFPMGAVQGTSDGLEWPIDGLALAPEGRIATSNRATGPVTVTVDAPNMLVILPHSCLEIAVRALVAPSGSWPARAAGHTTPSKS